MATDTPVRACICYACSFTDIKAMVEEHGWSTVEEITGVLGCGGRCGSCLPYLEALLRTGRTAFAVLPMDRNIDGTREGDA